MQKTSGRRKRIGLRRLMGLISKLEQVNSDKRENTLFAGIENSLRQLSSEIREKIKPLGVFQEGGSISNVANVLQLNDEERDLVMKQLMKQKK